MNIFAVIEVGSTTTKGYLYDNGNISSLDFVLIEFKKNYGTNGYICDSDKEKLFKYIEKIKKVTSNIHIYGTSIFRILKEDEKEAFLKEFNTKTGLDFKVVSSEEESHYTVKGVMVAVKCDGNIAIEVGGGGSVEIAILNNNEVIETTNLSFGCVDVTNVYPDLANDIADTDIREVIDYVKERIVEIHNKADVLVLAGAANKYFRETAHYDFIKDVPFTYDNKEIVVMDAKELFNQDKRYFYHTSLEEMKKNMPDSPNWWNATRATTSIVEAVSELVEAKYVAASDINMIYGIIEEIKASNN